MGEPDLAVVLFRFVPPSRWEGQTVARLVFLHPDTSMGLVREIITLMA